MLQKEMDYCHHLNLNVLLWMTFIGPNFLTRAQDITGPSCEPGWFGRKCQFQCHCQKKVPCMNITGDCPPGVPCELGMFGPKCQYVDLMKQLRATNTPSFLTDGDNKTCNPDPKARQLTIYLNQSVIFTWFRIQTDIDMSNHDFFVELDYEICNGRRMDRVSDQIQDVRCSDVRRPHKRLRIEGPVAGHICELYISGGRNVALKQPTKQSSHWEPVSLAITRENNAVDGDRNQEFLDGSCTSTGNVVGAPWWLLEYTRPQMITRIVIYGRNAHGYRLNGFTLELYGQDKMAPAFYGYNDTYMPSGVLLEHHVLLPAALNQYVMRIRIWIKEVSDLLDNVLTLCEVETFGETICESGYYGLDCEETCKCGTSRHCSVATGVGGNPCLTQEWAVNCTYPCQPSCLSKVCNKAMCISCNSGYKDPYCEVCPKGAFGECCSQSCSAYCQGSTCNATNGHCVACVGKKVMPLCIEAEKEVMHQKVEKVEDFNWMYLLLLLLLLPLAMCLLCCMRTKKSPPLQPEPESTPASKLALNAEEVEEIYVKGSSVDITERDSPSGTELGLKT